jgi:hypothetical protein
MADIKIADLQSVSGANKLSHSLIYTIEKINSINVDNFTKFFNNLPADPYLDGNYRFRRLSRFQVNGNSLIKLPHKYFFQSQQYNSLLGEVKREYPELDDAIIELDDFRNLILAFVEKSKLNTTEEIKINVHQFRIICDSSNYGEPAPEGIHRDAVDIVGIFSVKRENIEGGETHLYKSTKGNPVLSKILNPGELLVFNDQKFFHFTTAIKPSSKDVGIRDVFVLTFPAWEKVPTKEVE